MPKTQKVEMPKALEYRPYGEKVIVSRIDSEDKNRLQTASGVELYRPDVTVEESRFARIESVGFGLHYPEAVTVGTQIVIAKLAGEPWVAPDGRHFLIIHEADILLVLVDPDKE